MRVKKISGLMKRLTALTLSAAAVLVLTPSSVFAESVPTVTLRVCNWEEYVDFGDWDEEDVIDLESGDIFGENSVLEDFKSWYYETYGVRVNLEYSTFGANEDLYNMLTIGDTFDLVCPSEYMVMKLMAEDRLEPFSEEFFDTDNEYNYYARNVSPYIENIFETHEINGEPWSKYMAGYMWGVTGIVYNPDYVTEEDASTWQVLSNPDYRRRVTLKDNVRDSYFAALGAIKSDLLTSEAFKSDPDYHKKLEDEMNDTSEETVAAAQDWLQSVKNANAYSFESDAGKADMVTGKVYLNLQWSGDGVYTLDQAEEDDLYLAFTVPEECTNIYFDGWCMLKEGVAGNEAKQQAAEAFVNFMSRPDIAIRNMFYVGYTSCIAGNEDDTRIFEYADWNYGAEEDEEDTTDYSLAYFFSEDADSEDYTITAPTDQVNRQLAARYPSQETIARSSVMVYFNDEANDRINRMWINVRCFNIYDIPVWAWIVTALVILVIAVFVVKGGLRRKRLKK